MASSQGGEGASTQLFFSTTFDISKMIEVVAINKNNEM